MVKTEQSVGQLGLFEDDLFEHIEDRRLVDRFREFHAENPSVYSELVDLAESLRATGRRHYGMAGLFEVLRWNRTLKTNGDEFKLNNSYRAFYARLIMSREKSLDGFFRTRQSVADKE